MLCKNGLLDNDLNLMFSVHADLEALGGGTDQQGGISPLHDAVRWNQLGAAELLMQTILQRKGRTKLLEMLEKPTNCGRNVFQLCTSSQMTDLLAKYRNDEGFCSDRDTIVIDFPVNRYFLHADDVFENH